MSRRTDTHQHRQPPPKPIKLAFGLGFGVKMMSKYALSKSN